MARARPTKIIYPVFGVNRRAIRQTQPPFTSVDVNNCRAIDTNEGRERGGSRPMLERAYPQTLGKAGTISTSTKDNGTTTVVATTSVFEITDVGRPIVVDSTGNSYAISSFTNGGVVIVTGDASAETGTFVIGRPIRMLGQVTTALTDNSTSWRDDFDTGAAPGGLPNPLGVVEGNWTVATWVGDWSSGSPDDGLLTHGLDGPTLEAVGGLAPFPGGVAVHKGATIALLTAFDSAEPYRVTVKSISVPFLGYARLFIRLTDDGTGNDDTWYKAGGIMLELYRRVPSSGEGFAWTAKIVAYDETGTIHGTINGTGAYSVNVNSNVNAHTWAIDWTPATKKLTVLFGAAALVDDLTVTGLDSVTGIGIALEVETTEVNENSGYFDWVEVEYSSTATIDAERTYLVASSTSRIWADRETQSMVEGTFDTNLTLAADVPIHSAEIGQQLFIADRGVFLASATAGDASALSGSGKDFDGDPVNFASEGVLVGEHVLVITATGDAGTAVPGSYAITGVSGTHLTLAYSANGDVGTQDTNVAYRIENAPKYYDPLLHKIFAWAVDVDPDNSDLGRGTVPAGCPVIAFYNGRIVLAGPVISPHLWYMSRQGNPRDFDYNKRDTQRAIKATGMSGGRIMQPIRAWISHEGYAIIGCTDQLWFLRGDPTFSGTLNLLVNNNGILGPAAWCHGPNGEVIFMSALGWYMIPASFPPTEPVPLSRETLPDDLSHIDTGNNHVQLVWNNRFYGVDLWIVNNADVAQSHYFMDWRNKGIHPMSVSAVYEPTSVIAYRPQTAADAAALVGGKDGRVRRFSRLATDDDGDTVTSYVFIGPFTHHELDTAIDDLRARLDEGSGDVTWSVHVGTTAEEALDATARATGTFSAGLGNYTGVFAGGGAVYLKLSSTNVWAMEMITARFRRMGVTNA